MPFGPAAVQVPTFNPVKLVRRMNRSIVFVLLLAWSWVAMTLQHELGHIAVGCCSGGKLSSVELRPWCLPYSMFNPNPTPLLTLLAGPLLGCVVPLLFAWITKRPSVWFVAWFCIVANGLYLLVGAYSGDAELDSTKMIKAGTPTSVLVIASAAITVLGYVGFRNECQRVLASDPAWEMSKRVFAASSLGLVTTIIVQAVIGTAIK